MSKPFEALRSEYETLLARMVITREREVDAVAAKLLGFIDEGRYNAVSAETGIPVIWIATSFERESSSDFSTSPAQGDPWNRVSTHVPRGRGPFHSWAEAAIDAYHIDGTDRVGAENWTWARACYEGEVFNGMGYRARGIHSPYLWAGSNNYSISKFTGDGHFDPNHVDTQLGIVPVMARLVQMRAGLRLVDELAAPAPIPHPAPAPTGVGEHGDHDTAWLQAALNELHIEGTPLTVDNSYGRRTRLVVIAYQKTHGLDPDGIAGPLTTAQIEKEIAPPSAEPASVEVATVEPPLPEPAPVEPVTIEPGLLPAMTEPPPAEPQGDS